MKSRIRIGIDGRPLAYRGTGNARYLHLMLKNLIELRPHDEWILFSHRNLHSDYLGLLDLPNIHFNLHESKIREPGPVWLHLRLPGLLKKFHCNLFWATLAHLPLFYRKRISIPAMVNFHDLNAFVAPETMVFWNRWQHRFLNKATLQNSHSVLCLSESTKKDIIQQFPDIDENRLKVIYPGCELIQEKIKKPPEQMVKLKNFMLTVGSIEPRKNHKTLIEAYTLARQKKKNLLPLLIIGQKGWGDYSLYKLLLSGDLESRGIFYIENADDQLLLWAYKKAAFLISASIHEGFGLPVIEFLHLKKQVLLSDIPIFHEIVPDAAAYVKPTDRVEWCREIIRLNELFSQGEIRPPRFNSNFWLWKKRARVLSNLINEIIQVSR